ncbi:DNA polymerase III subunit delta [Candidatus Falkowbacteria bacterium]|nr:DNA polymerase III subunit delta [Candidatus Falkowbacteria bacterium]
MIIFLSGPDTFRSRRKLNEIKQKFITELDKSGLNIEVLNGEKLELSEFEKAVSTSPFLAKKRLVIVENLISKNKGQKLQKEILAVLEKNQLPDTIITFWEESAESGKPGKSKLGQKRNKLLLDRLTGEKYAQHFPLLDDAQTRRWTETEIKNQGGKIKADALSLLTDLVGNNLWQINSEINKLLSFTRGQEITREDVDNLVKTRLDEDIFRLTDALGRKNKALALKLISDQLQSGASPVELLSKIIWQTRNLLIIKNFVETNGPGYMPSRLGYQLGLHPFVVQKTMAQIKSHDLPEIKKNYQRLLKIDYQLKTSQISPEALFDLFVAKT